MRFRVRNVKVWVRNVKNSGSEVRNVCINTVLLMQVRREDRHYRRTIDIYFTSIYLSCLSMSIVSIVLY